MALLDALERQEKQALRDASHAAAQHRTTAYGRHVAQAAAYRHAIDLVVLHIGVTPQREDAP